VTVEELNGKLLAGEKPTVVDVREADELVQAAFPFPVLHIPMGELPARIAELPRQGTIVCACRSGARSAAVTRFLRKEGFDAVNLEGGILAWVARIGLGTPQY
jgi:rhodanese-related sulfurtransferase